MSYGFKIIVEGDYACFTRPEMKVERVSYDVPTPGALEGMLKSIYWKPAIKYVIDKIIIFNDINFINVRRNEVKEKLFYKNVQKFLNKKGDYPVIYTSEVISQRSSIILKNVKYGVEFHFEVTGIRNENEVDGNNKHYCIIKRRLEKGQFFRNPCLGCSEFPVKKLYIVDEFDENEISYKIKELGNIDLGFMSYKVMFDDEGKPINNDWDNPKFSDKAHTVYYRPQMINGIIDVAKYREGLKC